MIMISNFYGSVHRFQGHWVQTKYFIYNIKRLRYGNGVYVKGLPKPFLWPLIKFPFYGYITEMVYMWKDLKIKKIIKRFDLVVT
jgi:hypothetical protein